MTKSLFHVVDDGHAVLRSRGVYRQVKIFERDDELYAAFGAGYVKLLGNGHTSVPTLSWLDIVSPPRKTLSYGRLNVPMLVSVQNVRRVK